jgi:probable HAF family extracellular repeat protein
VPFAISNNGLIAGDAYTAGDASDHAFIYSSGMMLDLGTLPGGTSSFATAVNDNGQAAGYAYPKGGGTHAFLYTGGVMTDLGVLQGHLFSLGFGMNASGDVVGYCNGGGTVAFLYSAGTMTDLNSLIDPASGWHLSEAYAINNIGEIVGYGTINEQTHAFLLTPVPEPSSIALLTIGAIGLAALTRYRWQR